MKKVSIVLIVFLLMINVLTLYGNATEPTNQIAENVTEVAEEVAVTEDSFEVPAEAVIANADQMEA